ncbi:hypothetical protein ABAC460_07485 [Asticcacaulis sp. AC460]|uniref:hypothetical protein n=1 Tax=Asticcacaulis sp. AC460 TaxID=1282360 RepID=UPI0003C3DF4D|nr:hypothetical protein [Asticcacaulis sp. AC460]ESQ91066.1 hypothetical protein ABAC460_07485 [Asticcacaulis sp. AC460]
MNRRHLLMGAAALVFAPPATARAQAITTPMPAPDWALLQREALRVQSEAVEAFYGKYFDERGYFQCFERWGANDGPDDAIENCNDWPHLHALGGSDKVLELYKRAWEGHLKQYTEAHTVETPIARDGMYHREFPVMNDWQHLSEGLSVFNVMGLSDPHDPKFQERARRFAGFYTGEDKAAPNYDPKRKIIRSMISGSKGPMLRQATALDWAGDQFNPAGFFMEHGESTYQETLDHYVDYTDVVGDSPLNLQATGLVMNAYMIAGERKYRDWITSYLDAWIQRAKANGNVLPSFVDLKGRIGGKRKQWYGNVYGWGFSPIDPTTGKREDRNRVPRAIVAFLNAYLLTGDDKYLQVWRDQTAAINAQARTVDGVVQTPTMYGPKGWYGYKPGLYRTNGLEIWYMSMRADDLARADADHPWVHYLGGRNPSYPAAALRDSLEAVRSKMSVLAKDTTTRETRLADALLKYNPATVTSLLHLMCGAIHIARPPWSKTSPAQGGALLYARLRYFDPVRKRAGIPEDVAALVSELSDVATTVTLVNTHPFRTRTVVIQAGGYGEHQFTGMMVGGVETVLNASHVTLDLAPGCGAEVRFSHRRHVNAPSLRMPWDRT